MTTSIAAIFEGGLLRPVTPLKMAEGTRVELLIRAEPVIPGRSAARILAEIAALPTTGGDPRTSEDHDRILYGSEAAG